MSYFTWKEEGLTQDCKSLEAMAYRFEESAKLMRKMAKEGFILHKKNKRDLKYQLSSIYMYSHHYAHIGFE